MKRQLMKQKLIKKLIMKRIITTCCLFGLIIFTAKAQLSDTVYASTSATISVLFPSSISLVDVGNEDYAFEYDNNLLLLKAKKPQAGFTSLLVRYGDAFFMGVVGYQTALDQFYYDYRQTEYEHLLALGEEQVGLPIVPVPEIASIPQEEKAAPPTFLLETQLAQFKQLPLEKLRVKSCKKGGVFGKLEVVRNSDSCTFLRLRLYNTSTMPFEVEFSGLQYRERSRGKGLDDMVLPMKPLAAEIPEIVHPQDQATCLFAIPHFATSKRAKLEINIQERTGTRAIQFAIPSPYVLHAQTL